MAKKNSPSLSMLREFLRLAGLSGLIFIAVLGILLLILGWAYRDRVADIFLEGIQGELQADLSMGRVQMNLVRNFPLGSIVLHDIKLIDTLEPGKDRLLLETPKLQMHFSLADILRGDYTLRELSLSGGRLHLGLAGEERTGVLQSEPDGRSPRKGKDLSLNIRRIRVDNMEVVILHPGKELHIHTDIRQIDLRGELLSAQPDFHARGKYLVYRLEVAGVSIPTANKLYASETKASGSDKTVGAATKSRSGKKLEASLRISLPARDSLRIEDARLIWNHHHLTTEASFSLGGESPWIELQAEGHQVVMEQLLADLPESIRHIVTPYRPAGTGNFTFLLQGGLGPGSRPSITTELDLRHGRIRHPESGRKMQLVRLQGSYTNGERRDATTSLLHIRHLDGHMAGGRVEGSLRWQDFRIPRLHFDLRASLKAEDFLVWMPLEAVSQARGEIRMDLLFDGRMSDGKTFSNQDLLEAMISGHVEFRELAFVLDDKELLPYHGLHGRLVFDDSSLRIEELAGRAGESDFALTGQMYNVLPYLFLPGEHIRVQATLHSGRIKLDELLQQSKGNGGPAYRLRLPRRLRLQLDASIDELQFQRFVAEGVEAGIRMENQRLHADHLLLHAMDGRLFMHGSLDGRRPGHLLMQCQAQLVDVDIHQLFYQVGNFGQESLTHDNIYGQVTAELFFSSRWDPHLRIDWESVETTARVRVDDGRLVNYQPLIALSNFLRTSDLRDVSFSTLENEIHISERRILIPDMQVQSSALDLQVSGQHSFDNEIDYRLQVLLSDLLGRQHRERRNPQEDYGEIIDDGLGRTTLFLKLTGTGQDPELSYDYQGVRAKLRDDLREERQTLGNILRDEFGFLGRNNRDSLPGDSISRKDAREKGRERLRKQEEGEFVIEWEEFDF